jgi:hypothetical protein
MELIPFAVAMLVAVANTGVDTSCIDESHGAPSGTRAGFILTPRSGIPPGLESERSDPWLGEDPDRFSINRQR